jgi:hypothetical protein
MDIMRDQDRRIIRTAVIALALAAAAIAPVVGSMFLPGCVGEREAASTMSPPAK